LSLDTYEFDLFAFLLSKKQLSMFFTKIKLRHFRNDALRWGYKVLREHYKKYKSIPNLNIFKQELLKTTLSGDEKKVHFSVLKKAVRKRKIIDKRYVKDNIDKKIDREDILIALDKAVIEVDKENISGAKKGLIKALILGESDDDFPVINVFKDWKMRQIVRKKLSKIPIEQRFISTPFAPINFATYGIQQSEAATVAGLTGVGKSIMLGEFGLNSCLEGNNVLHFTLENTGEQTAQRYDSRLTRIKYDTIKLYEFDKSELGSFEKIFNIISPKMNSEIKIKETIRNKTDMVLVDMVIESLRQDGFNTQFLLLDSCDIMKGVGSNREYRLDRTSVYWDFKDYCKMKRLPGMTTTQLIKKAKGRKATTEDLSEAYDKARILDLVYIMSQTVEEEKRNFVDFAVNKNRDGATGAHIKLYKASEVMEFREIAA